MYSNASVAYVALATLGVKLTGILVRIGRNWSDWANTTHIGSPIDGGAIEILLESLGHAPALELGSWGSWGSGQLGNWATGLLECTVSGRGLMKWELQRVWPGANEASGLAYPFSEIDFNFIVSLDFFLLFSKI